MTLKQRQPIRLENIEDGVAKPSLASALSAGKLDILPAIPYRARLQLSGETLSVDADDDYGSLQLLDLPDRNLAILGLEADLVLTKAGTTNGLEAAVDLDVGIGTAAASAQTLASAMIDLIEKVDVDDNALAVDFEAVMVGQSTAAPPVFIADGASNGIYLNVGVPAGITADDSISVSGWVDLWVVDLGNRAS